MNDQTKKGNLSNRVFFFAIFIIPSLLCLGFYYFSIRKPLTRGRTSIFIRLPHFGPASLAANGKDSVFYAIPNFSFINQDGETFTDNNLNRKMYIVTYFSSTNLITSPKMATQLYRVQDKLNYLKKDFSIISITENPEFDTPVILKKYADKVHANPKLWTFLTGDKKELFKTANSTFINKSTNETTNATDSINLSKLVLIDKDKHIRGFYNGNKLSEIDRLIDEVVVLAAEYGQLKNMKGN